jgi:hypothetical protein
MKALADNLSTHFFGQFIFKWLVLRDLCLFETALCNKRYRVHILPYLNEFVDCKVFLGQIICFNSLNYTWLVRRNIYGDSVEQVLLNEKSTIEFAYFLRNHIDRNSFKSIKLNNYLAPNITKALNESFKISGLSEFHCTNFAGRIIFRTDFGAEQKQQTDTDINLQSLTTCPSLTNLNLSGSCIVQASEIWDCFPNLKTLNLSRCTFYGTDTTKSSDKLYLTKTIMYSERITDLNVSNLSCIDDMILFCIGENMRNLQSLDISYCRNISSYDQIVYVTTKCDLLALINVKGCRKHIQNILEQHKNFKAIPVVVICDDFIATDTSSCVIN